jgi:hypothetical protein
MKPEAQRIAIAEACRWTKFTPDTIQYLARGPDGKWSFIPDYLNDLNAMHEAEKLIFDSYDRSQWFQYVTHLQTACFCAGNETHMDHIHATAAQRAEAFLKTLELWT